MATKAIFCVTKLFFNGRATGADAVAGFLNPERPRSLFFLSATALTLEMSSSCIFIMSNDEVERFFEM